MKSGLFLSLFFATSAFAAPPAAQNQMRAPQEIELQGLERKVSLASPIGRIELRWTRESERLFGKTPERATIEAASTVAKALRQSSFPSQLKYLNLNWQIVFLSKDLKSGQVPQSLLSNCHPGWMTPPANIYIASEQVAGGCMGSPTQPGSVADAQLAQVLIHEIGHAVEYALAPQIGFDRARAEGFATWFEVFAGKYSGMLNSTNILTSQKLMARQRISTAAQPFQGTAADYSLASVPFHVVTDSGRSVSDLSRIYSIMAAERIPFGAALAKVTGWSDKKANDEVLRFLN